MNQYEKYVRGSIFLEEKTMNQECVNKFWILVNEAASKPNPPFSQELIDEAKKKCQNMLNPNVPEFLPRNAEALRENPTQAKADTLYQLVVKGLRQQKDLHIKSQNFQEAENVYQMCLICYTNHFNNYNCQTSDEENLTPTNSARWLEGQQGTPFPYTQPYFEGYKYQTDMDTGFSSSDDENLTPTESVQCFEHQRVQRVIQMDHQVTEGCYNPYYQNQVDNVWFDNYYLSTQ